MPQLSGESASPYLKDASPRSDLGNHLFGSQENFFHPFPETEVGEVWLLVFVKRKGYFYRKCWGRKPTEVTLE